MCSLQRLPIRNDRRYVHLSLILNTNGIFQVQRPISPVTNDPRGTLCRHHTDVPKDAAHTILRHLNVMDIAVLRIAIGADTVIAHVVHVEVVGRSPAVRIDDGILTNGLDRRATHEESPMMDGSIRPV